MLLEAVVVAEEVVLEEGVAMFVWNIETIEKEVKPAKEVELLGKIVYFGIREFFRIFVLP